MANFYVSSAAYAAIAPWAATTAYTVGQIIRPTAAVAGKRIAYRCTTGGTTTGVEPTWGLTLGGTTTNGAVFTAINSDTYGWSGAAGDVSTVTNTATSGFAAAGDKIFLSSDHSETTAAATNWLNSIPGGWTTLTTSILSVNRGGSVPPVSADLTSGASISFTTMNIDCAKPIYMQGLTLIAASGSISFGAANYCSYYLKDCTLQIAGSSASYAIKTSDYSETVLDNTSVSFGGAAQTITLAASGELTWINTASPLSGISPNNLFFPPSNALGLVTCRGVDFSAYTGNFVGVGSITNNIKVLFGSCKISASSTILTGTPYSNAALVELINCWDGTNVRNERYTTGGSTVTERTITLTGGAADDVGSFSLKMASGSARIDKWVAPIASFWLDVENTSTGSSKTATVEIVSSASLNNDDIWLLLEYMGTAGSQLASFVDSNPVTPLTAAVAVTTSTAAWNSAPATPVYQKLQVTFTPQRAGRVRGRVMLGKASTTVYVNPNIVIT
jgi:hypothetical protein